jgi:hypothetical protein
MASGGNNGRGVSDGIGEAMSPAGASFRFDLAGFWDVPWECVIDRQAGLA